MTKISMEVPQGSQCEACVRHRNHVLGMDQGPPQDEPVTPKTIEDWRQECQELRGFVEELQCRLQQALKCAEQMHAECEKRVQAERKDLEVRRRESQKEFDIKVQDFEADKERCQACVAECDVCSVACVCIVLFVGFACHCSCGVVHDCY